MGTVEPLIVVRWAIGAGVPVLGALWMLVTQRAEKQRVLAENARRLETGDLRPPDERKGGIGKIRVHVVGGGHVNLGSSIESAESLSGTPTLQTAAFLVEDDGGQRFSISAGATLSVRRLGGARRNLLESITKETGGVDQRFSFEVDPQATFVLKATFPEVKESQGAFREGPLALEGPLEINPNVDVERAEMGCMVYPVLVVGAALAIYPTELFWEVCGWVAWTLAMLLALVGRLITNDSAR